MGVQTHLAAVRRMRKISATDLARRAQISRQTLHSIETGTYVPNTSVALRLARLLDVRVEQLFSLEEEDANQTIEASLLAPAHNWPGMLVQLGHVDGTTVAVPSDQSNLFIGPADAILSAPGKDHSMASFRIIEHAALEKNLIVAGCDPALPILAHHAAKEGIQVIPWYCNSSQALELLQARRIHIAGCHLRDGQTGESNTTAIARRFSHVETVVITLASWEEGIVVASGNPKQIFGFEDLVRSGIALINREFGAGTRKLLDDELSRRSIPPGKVEGYENTVNAHVTAARTVAEGRADCCIAPYAVAKALGLGFIPLGAERYDFVTRREFLDTPVVQTIFNVLAKRSFQHHLAGLGGYDTSITGRTISQP